MGAFAAVHTAAVIGCFPATILFELAAGLLFGVLNGAAIAWSAKVLAAVITFLLSSGIARAALSDAGVDEAAARAFAAQPSLERLAQRVESDGARFTLLARLSPIPSWLNNYGLAFAGVRFADYAPATALATLPAVLTHVYAGSLVSSLLELVEGDAATAVPSSAGSALGALSALGGGLLLREVASAAASEEETAAAVRSRKAGSQRAGEPKASLGDDETPNETPNERVLLDVWRAVRDNAPPLVTGAGAADGEDDPGAALFNAVFIRLPFLALCAALAANILLGGGVAIGGYEWPPPSGSLWSAAGSLASGTASGTDAWMRLRGGSVSTPLTGLRAAIVGAGASGLLLAHRLLDAGASVTLLEARGDPRDGRVREGRAYALGLGLRGRTAIRAVDERLWQAVKAEGFGSDRFTLHAPFGAFDLRKPTPGQEPSVLIYQTDLCAAMLGELEARHQRSGRLDLQFRARVESVDTASGALAYLQSNEEDAGDSSSGGSAAATTSTFDLIAGCDGVQSAVRASIAAQCASFAVEQRTLGGNLKVLRLAAMPSALAPDAVHLVPGTGGLAAFLEPTARGEACALISWRGDTLTTTLPDGAKSSWQPASVTDADVARLALARALPLIADALNTTAVGEQFVSQRVSTASTVRCNSYSLGRAALLGDAAHSTGGASGQGCNSALQDAISLSDALIRCDGDVAAALPAYSRERVPEGTALLDLSTGVRPDAPPTRKLLYAAASAADFLLSPLGLRERPLQTLLTTSLTPFAEIRRKRETGLGPFPTDAEFAAQIDEVA